MSHFPAEIAVRDLIGLDRPTELRAVAVTTANGAARVDGDTGTMGNATDTALLLGLRDWADVVLVGAGTVIAEDYGGSPTPLAVVTRRLSLDPGARLFAEGSPLLLVPRPSLDDPALAHRRAILTAAGATLVSTGAGTAEDIVTTLHSLGHHRITCEGGPGMYSQLFRADLVDVLHLTVDPVLHSPADMQLLRGDVHRRLALDHLTATADGTVFLRYRRNPLG